MREILFREHNTLGKISRPILDLEQADAKRNRLRRVIGCYRQLVDLGRSAAQEVELLPDRYRIEIADVQLLRHRQWDN